MSAHATPGTQIDPALVDRLLELYCDWRTECSAVQTAYERFLRAPAAERELAFSGYSAALDREGSAAELYGAQVRLVASLAGAPDPPTQP